MGGRGPQGSWARPRTNRSSGKRRTQSWFHLSGRFRFLTSPKMTHGKRKDKTAERRSSQPYTNIRRTAQENRSPTPVFPAHDGGIRRHSRSFHPEPQRHHAETANVHSRQPLPRATETEFIDLYEDTTLHTEADRNTAPASPTPGEGHSSQNVETTHVRTSGPCTGTKLVTVREDRTCRPRTHHAPVLPMSTPLPSISVKLERGYGSQSFPGCPAAPRRSRRGPCRHRGRQRYRGDEPGAPRSRGWTLRR